MLYTPTTNRFINFICSLHLSFAQNTIKMSDPSVIDQNEKAFQKQDGVFLARKKVLGRRTTKGLRFVRNVGLGFKTPKSAWVSCALPVGMVLSDFGS